MTSKQISKLLSKDFWPETLEVNKFYTRVQDDHDGTFEGQLSVAFNEQGDAWVATDKHRWPAMRFRNWCGGGMSLRTRNALLILAEAIRLDNQEKPQQILKNDQSTNPN